MHSGDPSSPGLWQPCRQLSQLLLLSTHPLVILLPLPLDIPESPSSLTLSADSTIEAQESVRVALTQDLLSFPCVLAIGFPAFPRDLTCPFGVLNWLQLVRRDYDARGEEEDADKELESDVKGKRGAGEGCGVFVCGVDARSIINNCHSMIAASLVAIS